MNRDRFLASQSSQAVWDDYVDFKVALIDNGDNKVILQVWINEAKTLEINCGMFIPFLEPCHVMLAGSGSATYIK